MKKPTAQQAKLLHELAAKDPVHIWNQRNHPSADALEVRRLRSENKRLRDALARIRGLSEQMAHVVNFGVSGK